MSEAAHLHQGRDRNIPGRGTIDDRFNPNQAYVIGDRHIGFQCHIEMTPELVEAWCQSGAGEVAATAAPSRQSCSDMLRDLPERVAALQAVADGIYARWAQGLAR